MTSCYAMHQTTGCSIFILVSIDSV